MEGVVGRERELGEANTFLTDAAARCCGLLLVGEAGIGKTTVWSAILDEAARRGRAILTARPSQGEAELPFAVLTDLFDHVDDGAMEGLPTTQRAALDQALRRSTTVGTADPTAVALAVLGALRALSGSAAALIAVDDLQWADTPSLRALTFAFRRLADAPVGLVATMRTGFEDDLTEIAARDPRSLRRIEIAGLDKRHLAQLVLDRAGRALSPPQLEKLARLSGGNPYYALEIAASADGELRVPETLAATLRGRLASLSDDARAVGLAAATLGRVDATVIGRVHGTGLDELRRTGTLDVRTGDTWFAHPLLASTLLDMHTAEERRGAHLALAEALLDDPDERALHLGRGTSEPAEDVALELESAAHRLDARGAPETAATLAERAAELTPADDGAAATRRRLLAADLFQAAGEGREHVLPLLEDMGETLPAGPDRARALVRLGWLGALLDTMPMSGSVSYQERALAEAQGELDVVTTAHAVLARLLGVGGDFRGALSHAELAAAAAGSVEPNPMFPSPFGELGIARFFAGEGLDEGLFARGIEVEARAGRVGEPYQSPRLQLGLALFYAGQLSRARPLLQELLGLSVELGRIRSTAGCVLHLTELEVRAGNLAQADAHAQEFVHLDLQLRGELSAEWYPSGLVAAHLGRVDDARRILSAGAEESRAIESTIWLAHQLGALGQLELALGNLAAAREALVPLPELLRATGLGEWSVHPVHPDAIEVLVALGELEEAATLQAELEDYGRRLDRAWGIATAARSEALIASARGEQEHALAAAERALAEHERLEWPFEHARTLLVAGSVLRRLGRRRDAARALETARSIFASLGNPLWLAKVESEARRLGGRRSARDELTPTEARVAQLAAEGLRNAEIAARLFVTPKTVEATLSRVYRKLAIRSRTELARNLSGRSAEREPGSVPAEPAEPA